MKSVGAVVQNGYSDDEFGNVDFMKSPTVCKYSSRDFGTLCDVVGVWERGAWMKMVTVTEKLSE